MLNAIINWAVPFLFGGAVSLICTLFAKNRAYKDGLRCLLRAEIIRCYDKYTERGEIPIYAKEALEKEYKAYHKLGGNDVATDLYNKTMKLKVRK